MKYIKIEFTSGLSGIAYQEVGDRSIVSAYLDELGQEIKMTDATGNSIAYEANVVDDNPLLPFPPRVPEVPTVNKDALQAILQQAFATFAEKDPAIAEAIRNDILSQIV